MDTSSTPQSWFNGVLGLLLTVLGVMLNIYRRKVDALEQCQNKYVTKEDLEQLFIAAHNANTVRLDSIDTTLRRLDDRIYDMVKE